MKNLLYPSTMSQILNLDTAKSTINLKKLNSWWYIIRLMDALQRLCWTVIISKNPFRTGFWILFPDLVRSESVSPSANSDPGRIIGFIATWTFRFPIGFSWHTEQHDILSMQYFAPLARLATVTKCFDDSTIGRNKSIDDTLLARICHWCTTARIGRLRIPIGTHQILGYHPSWGRLKAW